MSLLSIQNLSVRLGSHAILKDISGAFQAGSMTAVLGKNGAGKSTLLKAVAGLASHSGQVALSSPENTAKRFVYVPQLDSVTSRLSVFETVLLGLTRELAWRVSDEHLARTEAVLERLKLTALSSRSVSELSGGQKQLVYLAQAFVSRPCVLLLDEPTSALDIRHQLVVLKAVKSYARQTRSIVLFAIHDLMMASRFADRVLLLRDGGVAAFDTPERVLTSERLDPIYRIRTHIEKNAMEHMTLTPIRPL